MNHESMVNLPKIRKCKMNPVKMQNGFSNGSEDCEDWID